MLINQCHDITLKELQSKQWRLWEYCEGVEGGSEEPEGTGEHHPQNQLTRTYRDCSNKRVCSLDSIRPIQDKVSQYFHISRRGASYLD